MHPSETVRSARKWRAQAQLNHPGLGEKVPQSETRPVPTKVSESSQNPLSSGRRRERARQ